MKVTLTKGTDPRDRPVDSKAWFTYEDNGSRLTYSYDSDRDESKLERSATYENTYHSDGNKTINFLFDINGDDRPDRNATFVFNANGDLVTKKCDRGNNGTIDMNCRATFDDNGNETKWYCDTNEDGEIDFKFDMTYNDNNNLIEEIKWSETQNPRRPDYTNTYMYDEDNNRIKKNHDKNSDGSTDSVTTYVWIEIPTE